MMAVAGMGVAAALAATAAAAGRTAEPARLLDRAEVLPLTLDDAFQFRKVETYLNDPDLRKTATDRMIMFEQKRIEWGAITEYDRKQRQGNYFTFFWRARRSADVTFRLEYRQERLGSYVQAREVTYQGVKGSVTTRINVIGDDYRDEGRVTAWRALLIEDGKIVGLTQSFLWN